MNPPGDRRTGLNGRNNEQNRRNQRQQNNNGRARLNPSNPVVGCHADWLETIPSKSNSCPKSLDYLLSGITTSTTPNVQGQGNCQKIEEGSYFPGTRFWRRGESTSFVSNALIEDPRGPRREKIHVNNTPDTILYAEYCFGLVNRFGMGRNVTTTNPNVPQQFSVEDHQSVSDCFNDDHPLKCELANTTDKKFSYFFNGKRKADKPTTGEYLVLLIVRHSRGTIGQLFHPPTGILFPTFGGGHTRLGRRIRNQCNHRNQRSSQIQRGIQNVTNMIRRSETGGNHNKFTDGPDAWKALYVTRRTPHGKAITPMMHPPDWTPGETPRDAE